MNKQIQSHRVNDDIIFATRKHAGQKNLRNRQKVTSCFGVSSTCLEACFIQYSNVKFP